MVIKLTQKQRQEMYRHGENTYPEECCGILFGYSNQETTVVEIWETEKVWESEENPLETNTGSKRDRFTIAPKTLLEAQKYAREENLTIAGIYHSHPDQVAIPSEFDRAIAWETYSYIIMSVKAKTVVACRSWKLNDQQQFEEEVIVTEGWQ